MKKTAVSDLMWTFWKNWKKKKVLFLLSWNRKPDQAADALFWNVSTIPPMNWHRQTQLRTRYPEFKHQSLCHANMIFDIISSRFLYQRKILSPLQWSRGKLDNFFDNWVSSFSMHFIHESRWLNLNDSGGQFQIVINSSRNK